MIAESNRCPVRWFVIFIERLNRNCTFLFQQPKICPEGWVYYQNVVVGQNKLGAVMSEITFSIRATTVHLLCRAQIPDKDTPRSHR